MLNNIIQLLREETEFASIENVAHRLCETIKMSCFI